MAVTGLISATRSAALLRRGISVSVLVFLATTLAACSGDSPVATPISTPPPTSTAVPTALPTATPLPSPTPMPTPMPTPIPTRAASPSPTPTPVPLATATVKPSNPSTGNLTDLAYSYLTALLVDLGPRESATLEELEAAEYLAAKWESFGYSVQLQPFTFTRLSRERSGLVLDGPDLREIEAIPLVRSGTGEVSGNLVSVGLAREGDVPEGGLEGKVALAQRGIITFEEKTNRLAEAGAIAVVIYNNRPGVFQGVLANQGRIPALGIAREDGQSIEELLSVGDVEAVVSVTTEEHESRNVVAIKPGPGSDVVVLGGHYDTVPNIAAANDNASGTAVLLTIAEQLSNESLPFTIQFVAFGSEELGLLGSRHYLDSLSAAEQERIKAMLNFDALGSGEQLGLLGDRELTSMAIELAEAQEIDVRLSIGIQGGSSDHASFRDVGIPVLMFFANDFSRIHTPEDTLEFVSAGLLGDSARLGLVVLRSPEFQTFLK